jgi:hypothetical protein
MAVDALPESSTEESRKWAVVFDFDTDSCYPSAAISPTGEINEGLSVTGWDPSFVDGCRAVSQLSNSNTYHRAASIRKDGALFVVRMYALYFLKDKDVPTWQPQGLLGHRHDWEYALVWLTNGVLTHATVSTHQGSETKAISDLHFDAGAPNSVRVVYHKNSVTTHCMRFAGENEQAENEAGRWITPTIVDWHSMTGNGVSNENLRSLLNTHSFGEADCSVNDTNFPFRISQEVPDGYPSADEWKAAANRVPIEVVSEPAHKTVPIGAVSEVGSKGVHTGIASKWTGPGPK